MKDILLTIIFSAIFIAIGYAAGTQFGIWGVIITILAVALIQAAIKK